MGTPWERLFMWAARGFAWIVLLLPVGVLAALLTASFAGQQRQDAAFFAVFLATQLAMTLAVGVIGAAAASSIGIGTALLTREQARGRAGQTIALAAVGLGVFPSVAIGWFAATFVLPALGGHTAAATFVVACIAVTLTAIPRSNRLADRTLAMVSTPLREAATAAGAQAGRLSAHVLLPTCKPQFIAIFTDALSRGVGEAAAVSIIFLAAARAGYPMLPFTLGSGLIAHAQTLRLIDAGIAQSAVLLMVFGVAAKIPATRRMRELQWVL